MSLKMNPQAIEKKLVAIMATLTGELTKGSAFMGSSVKIYELIIRNIRTGGADGNLPIVKAVGASKQRNGRVWHASSGDSASIEIVESIQEWLEQ
jgi:hypothetical protein